MSIPLDLDASAFASEDDAQYQGGGLLAAGTYHVVVDEVEDKFDTHEQINFAFKALAGTTPGEEGKTKRVFLDFREDTTVRDPLWKCNRSKLQWTQLWMSLGLLKAGGKCDGPNPADAVGLECIVRFTESNKNDRNGKPFVNFDRSFSLDNPEVAEVPRGSSTVIPAAISSPAAATETTGDAFDDL